MSSFLLRIASPAVAMAVILILWLNRSAFGYIGWLSVQFVTAALAHIAWVSGYFSIVMCFGLRYRNAQTKWRLAVSLLALPLVFILGSAWSALLFAISLLAELWANDIGLGSIEVISRIVSRLEYAHPWSSLAAYGLVLLLLFWPSPRITLN